MQKIIKISIKTYFFNKYKNSGMQFFIVLLLYLLVLLLYFNLFHKRNFNYIKLIYQKLK